MKSKNYKIMFVFVNDRMRTVIPLNISYLSAALKNDGFSTYVFDTSFYKEHERLNEERKKEDAGIFKPVDYSTIGVFIKTSSLIDDLLHTIESESPNLIGFSVYSQAKNLNFKIAEKIKNRFPHIPIILGGIHTNIEPERVLSYDFVDYICLGEGEKALVEFVNKMYIDESVEDVQNIGLKKDGQIIINPCRPPQNLDELPFLDWECFAPYHQFGPYRGKLLKMALVEGTRTCPYNCTYCGNTVYKQHYKNSGHKLSYRHKSPMRLIEELKFYKKNYGIEFINFVDGTFVAQKESVFEELAPLYKKEINLPFFCDATVHCITFRKAELLKDMGCVSLNIGLETGNEEYRKKYLDRSMSNEKIIKAFHIAKEANLETRSYNIIGLPFQTRNDIFDTIELNRTCCVSSVSLSIFVPYEGTKLREVCIKEGLLDPEQEIIGDGTCPIIKNPYISNEELMGLYNTFSIYVLAPREVFPLIKLAEAETDFGKQLRKELVNIYY